MFYVSGIAVHDEHLAEHALAKLFGNQLLLDRDVLVKVVLREQRAAKTLEMKARAVELAKLLKVRLVSRVIQRAVGVQHRIVLERSPLCGQDRGRRTFVHLDH